MGADWVCGRRRILSHAIFCNGKIEGFCGEMIDIHDALNTKFNYDELMGESAVK